MPIYEFECPGCGEPVSKIVPIQDYDSLSKDCPFCGSVLKRIYSPFSIFMGKMGIVSHRKFKFPHLLAKDEKASKRPIYSFPK